MAEFRADHEIVTNFLLNTCRLDPLLNINLIQALCDCAGVDNKCVSTDDDEIHYIPVNTGSSAEFYIQPMLNVEC